MALLKSALFSLLLISTPTLANDIAIEKLTRLDGSQFSTDKNRLLVYFWATWCVNCMPKLRTDLPEMKVPENGQIITVNTDKELSRAQHFIAEESLKVPVMRDENKSLMASLKAYAVPFWAVLERNGSAWKVLTAKSGGTADEMKAALWK